MSVIIGLIIGALVLACVWMAFALTDAQTELEVTKEYLKRSENSLAHTSQQYRDLLPINIAMNEIGAGCMDLIKRALDPLPNHYPYTFAISEPPVNLTYPERPNGVDEITWAGMSATMRNLVAEKSGEKAT